MSKYLAPPTLLASSVLLGLSLPATSEVVNDAMVPPAQNTVVVTAARLEQPADAALASVTVLDRAAIERTQARDFVELITRVPGVDISRDGGPGSNSSLFLRGTNADHTLFLLNGQRISSASLGSTSFQFLDPEQIERIEVVRGPRSSLYGSDAIGGVIQIFTRRAAGDKPSGYISAGAGDHHSYQAAAGGQAQWQQLRLSAHASHFFTDGISTLDEKTPPNDDRDAYRNSSASFNAGYDFSGGGKVDLNHFYARNKNEYDDALLAYNGIAELYTETWMQSTDLTARIPLANFWNTTASVGRSVDDIDNYDKDGMDPDARSDFRTERKSASWQNDFTVARDHTLTAGVDYYDDHLESSNEYFDVASNRPRDSRDNIGYFAQYLAGFGPLDLQAGFRQDDNEAFGKNNTRNFSAGLALPANHRVVASYGTAFKAPTFNDLYFPPDGFGSQGNPDLRPESSKNREIALHGNYEVLQWSLSYYRNTVKDLINWAPLPNVPFGYAPSNVESAKIEGGELIVNAQVQQFLIAASFNYVDPRDTETDNLLVKRARRSAKLDIDRPIGKASVGLSWYAQDYRFSDSANTQRLSGYGLLDLRAGYKVAQDWQLGLKLTNVLDKKVVLNRSSGLDYNQPRAGWFATVTYRL